MAQFIIGIVSSVLGLKILNPVEALGGLWGYTMIALTLLAQITNKALPSALQDASSPAEAGAGLGKYIGVLWQTAWLWVE